jgi:hypothetical protein
MHITRKITLNARCLHCWHFIGWSHYLKTKNCSFAAILILEVAASCIAPCLVDELALLQSGPVGAAQ